MLSFHLAQKDILILIPNLCAIILTSKLENMCSTTLHERMALLNENHFQRETVHVPWQDDTTK